MLACVDVGYRDDCAFSACVAFREWTDAEPAATYVASTSRPSAYEPGAFYLRELPPILAALALVPDELSTMIVDGYVWLGESTPGLGARLHAALGASTHVVGVAKTKWHMSGTARPATEADPCRAIEVTRGAARRPLYVTAVGLDVAVAAERVRGMSGSHRIPTLLKTADRQSRLAAAAARDDRAL